METGAKKLELNDTNMIPNEKAEKGFQFDTPFPENLTLEECRAAVKGQKEFRETLKDDLLILNYDYCYNGSFPDPAEESDPQKAHLLRVRRECRGLIFDRESHKLLSRRLHKFFNIGEGEENIVRR
jgi:RNA ligase